MKLSKEQIQIIAMSERLMDEGKVPWVMAPNPLNKGTYERLPISPEIMEELGLKQGQTINSIIFDAVAELSQIQLKEMITNFQQSLEEVKIDPDFDFRSMLNGEGDEPSTKH